MKKFLQIYLGMFILMPLALCAVVYLVGCFISWSILEVDIQWEIVRIYVILSAIIAFFLTIDE